MFDDEKIKIIEQMPEADTILIIWVKLLAQAGKTNASGYIYLNENIPFTDEMLSMIFNRPLPVVRLALQTLQQFGMIDITDNNFISITNWEKHQNVEGLDRIREQARIRQARYRNNKRIELEEDDKGKGYEESNVTVTSRNAPEEELELDLELELEKESNKDIVDKSPIEKLYEHYLTKKIISHNKMTGPMKTAANARLKDYPYEQLIQAIDNYATIYKGEDYWFNTRYGFADLMRDKDIRKFIDDADPLSNFIERFPNRGGNNATDKRSAKKSDEVQSRVNEANERRKRIAGIKPDRNPDNPV